MNTVFRGGTRGTGIIMTHRRITLADLVFGEPLRWDIFGPGAKADSAPDASPLLQKGQVLAPSPQLNGWLEAGLFAEASAAPSVLHALNDLNKRLEQLLLSLRNEHAADAAVRAIANELIAAVDIDPDIALACIFQNQIAGLYAVRHCIETAVVAVLVARAMQKPDDEVLTITAAALTMNVGMVRQTEGFQGKDCSLSNDERAIVRRHPIESVDLLRCAGVADPLWLDYVLLHHENDDGSGYPDGKLGADIPQNAKLIGLADRYCAHVSARNYRRSILPDLALRNLFVENALPIDPALADQFIRQLGKYPPGSLVRMENGEIGVVTRRLGADTLTVHALLAADGAALPEPTLRSTTEPACGIAEALHEDHARVRFSMRQIWGERASL